MRLKLLACEIFFREVCHVAAGSPHVIDVEFLPKGLHDLGVDRMRPRLQERIDAGTGPEHDAVLLAYGLCNNGVVGLTAGTQPLIIPRSHDCIGIFMADRRFYTEYFNSHPGTYYRTTGWYERNDTSSAGEETVPQKLGLFLEYEKLVEQYGEDNARYIMETMGDATAHYDHIAFISVGLPCEEPFRERAEREAGERGWSYERIEGSMELLRKLLCAEWDDNFLVVEPGQAIEASHDEGVVRPACCDRPGGCAAEGTAQTG